MEGKETMDTRDETSGGRTDTPGVDEDDEPTTEVDGPGRGDRTPLVSIPCP